MNYVYILQSEQDGRYYIGSTNNLERRLKEHLRGKTHSTKRMLPLKFVFGKEFNTFVEARQEERRLKKQKSHKYIENYVKVR